MSALALLKIPRWIKFDLICKVQIHGFCDASERAYCAAVYFRIQNETDVFCNLFVSKTKVAPITPVSLPRLELCGAVLLSKLVKQVTGYLSGDYELVLWTDSSIVLGWLGKPPNVWKTYVANRTAQIIRNVGNASWRHVQSADNPADLGSRGCDAKDLQHNALWWNEPVWLIKGPEEWPKPLIIPNTSEEQRKTKSFHLCTTMSIQNGESNEETENDILHRFSKWDRAIRVLAYVIRFFTILKRRRQASSQTDSSLDSRALLSLIRKIRRIDHLEFVETKNRLIRLTQYKFYRKEYESLGKLNNIGKKSSLLSLNPFLDDKGIMRANGRISESNLPFRVRHPIILPANSYLCKLLINFTHTLLMHADINLMLRTIREEYYVPRLKSVIRYCVRNCVVCCRYKQKLRSQMMGNLPKERSSFSLPFTFTGLDFAGPFQIKSSLVRNAPYHKGYVCIFVCFSTRAVHLELCSDLTSNSFLAAFVRFVSRRGLPRKVMSDNGTNFVGAERTLRLEYEEFMKSAAKEVSDKYSSHNFQWMFIPPNAPHMGGLWEAGVKSFKMHFRKVAQSTKYTYEEFSTLLARIEAVLNSRPLSPMSDDPNELLAPTPGHFLRGAPLVAIPEIPTENISFSDRWERIKSLHHQFAQRWKTEYLTEIQKRYKWQHEEENLKIGQLVVITDDSLPPNEWKLGRIVKIYLGNDGLVRVADIRTQNGIITRSISKLCVLPVNSAEDVEH